MSDAAHPLDALTAKRRYYGVAVNEKGKLVAFVVRDKDKVPVGALEVHETTRPAEANGKALKLLDAPTPVVATSSYDDDLPEVGPGTVAWYNDDRGCHMALVLEVTPGGMCKALFFTSNPRWNPTTRRATKDELALAGFVTKKRTYLAPVIRPLDGFSSRRVSFPSHRVTSLFREFFGVRAEPEE